MTKRMVPRRRGGALGGARLGAIAVGIALGLLLGACSPTAIRVPAQASPNSNAPAVGAVAGVSIVKAGQCYSSGVCTRLELRVWQGVAFTPPVTCAAPGATTVESPGAVPSPADIPSPSTADPSAFAGPSAPGPSAPGPSPAPSTPTALSPPSALSSAAAPSAANASVASASAAAPTAAPATKAAPTTCHLGMNVFAPTSTGPWPLIVLSPGGPAGVENQFYLDDYGYAAVLASQGAVVMESPWRQANFVGSGYPTAFADIACAIGVARKTGAAYGASPGLVTLVGHSLGGWAAAVVLLTPSGFKPAPGACDPTFGSLRPDAVVIVDGSVDELTSTRPGDGADYIQAFLGGSTGAAALPGALAAVDPYALAKRNRAGAGAPRVVLIHGGLDDVVPPASSRVFQDALVAAGYDSRLVEIPAADHLSVFSFRETIDTIMSVSHGK